MTQVKKKIVYIRKIIEIINVTFKLRQIDSDRKILLLVIPSLFTSTKKKIKYDWTVHHNQTYIQERKLLTKSNPRCGKEMKSLIQQGMSTEKEELFEVLLEMKGVMSKRTKQCN